MKLCADVRYWSAQAHLSQGYSPYTLQTRLYASRLLEASPSSTTRMTQNVSPSSSQIRVATTCAAQLAAHSISAITSASRRFLVARGLGGLVLVSSRLTRLRPLFRYSGTTHAGLRHIHDGTAECSNAIR